MINTFDWSVDHVMIFPVATASKQPERHCNKQKIQFQVICFQIIMASINYTAKIFLLLQYFWQYELLFTKFSVLAVYMCAECCYSATGYTHS